MSDLKTASWIILSALMVLVIILFSTINKTTAFAHSYRVIVAEFYPHPDRKRVAWHIIAPSAITIDDRAATVLNAAQNLYEETQAEEVTIWLQPDERLIGDGRLLAKIDAFPALAKFNIIASDLIFTPDQTEILVVLSALRPQFTHGNQFDDVGLYREVRRRFGLSNDYWFPQPIPQDVAVPHYIVLGGKDQSSAKNPPSFYR